MFAVYGIYLNNESGVITPLLNPKEAIKNIPNKVIKESVIPAVT